ncbi:hypothetical protein Q1695_014981 [Nippostrongylus brasiliensis]|nr:hypothetical protein Q1695_014981 [Nippostrongylus brasiliensis]
MNFMRRLTLSDESPSSSSSCREQKSPRRGYLEIVDDREDRRARKRDSGRSPSASVETEGSSSKRRKTSHGSFSFGNLFFNPVKAMFRLISGDNEHECEDNDEEPPSRGGNASNRASTSADSGKNRFRFPETPTEVDLTSEPDDDDEKESEIQIVAEVSRAAPPSSIKQLEHAIVRSEVVDLCDSGGSQKDDSAARSGEMHNSYIVEKQDECDVVVHDVLLEKEVELQEDSDDVEVVAEFCRTPRGSLAANRRSVEYAKEQVTSMSVSSPNGSNSSLSISVDGRLHGDQLSMSSPAPEDSISRQGTPHGLRFETPSPRSDPWRRRRTGVCKSKPAASPHSAAIGRAVARARAESGKCNGVPTRGSSVNLPARDRLLDILKKSGHEVNYPSKSECSSFLDYPLRKRKPFKSTTRGLDGNECALRVTSILDKFGGKAERRRCDEGNDLCRTIERQPSSEKPSSRSDTPMSTQSSGIDRITELLDKFDSFGRRPTPQHKYNRFVAERRELRDREIALKEEVRIRNQARQVNRELIEEKTRQRLELIGIRVPAPKPKVKDEFPPLTSEARELCERVWDRRQAQSEEFSEGFGIKLTRKDLTTLSGLDWLNDEVINFYLQLVCQRSSETKGLPKAYAFNTYFYTNIVSKGYASVKRWTRKVDIFAHDILLVPIHLSVHWCMAVVDLAEKRIDYYDSLMGKNQKCLGALKDYLSDECKDKKKEVFDFGGWEFKIRTDIPRQMNGSDCGVFACKFAEFASRRAPIVFTQEHMPYYRQRMVYELVTKKLL